MELLAPSHWRTVDFISDLHLQAEEPQTHAAWGLYLSNTPADAVFILGDLFEVWVGDDVINDASSFEAACAQVMRQASQRLDLFVMHGNRDFLMGDQLMERSGSTLLPDPCCLVAGDERWLLSHGDALCVDDVAYQEFRAQVRSSQWQREFLARPLFERQAIARQLRTQSEARKATDTSYADVDTPAALDWLRSHHSTHLIHGHTHRPGHHMLQPGYERTVLSDWDLSATQPRAEVLRLALPAASAGATRLRRLPLGSTNTTQP
ncbi:MAG: UDP-2,3-diacylglucosamine diphosphatase [Rhodoferax sp.]|nr:UDP-2,3-diacylglucosamine diphosphatase [Rhodoferax sp.]